MQIVMEFNNGSPVLVQNQNVRNKSEIVFSPDFKPTIGFTFGYWEEEDTRVTFIDQRETKTGEFLNTFRFFKFNQTFEAINFTNDFIDFIKQYRTEQKFTYESDETIFNNLKTSRKL